jgi:hypothetical protein
VKALLVVAALVTVAIAITLKDETQIRPEAASAAAARETYQGKDLSWWAYRAVRNRREANQQRRNSEARGRTIKRLKRDLRVRWAPTTDYAYRLAAAAYGVSQGEMRSIGYCESKHYPFARNGQYRGVMQEGPMFERGPFGRAGFSVYDPIANVMTAAAARVADGSWRQWECKP